MELMNHSSSLARFLAFDDGWTVTLLICESKFYLITYVL